MSQYERMLQGLIYDPADPEIMAEQSQYQKKVYEFNLLRPEDAELKQKYMKEVFAECGVNCYIELPLRANWGGHHLHFGNNVYANFNLTVVDDGHIYVGDNVMFAPNVTIATANHPMEPSLRRRGMQYVRDVHIEENVWIGSNVVICPGVTIGANSVIGAGSVVTRDIPAYSFAAGTPCRVLRTISTWDHSYFWRDEPIDWENLIND
ncbi:MAG: sugar O-acetyltransferase [Solobacterium sp.]|nr:sugar O-acetyltransferase [Solobacterium sp.]